MELTGSHILFGTIYNTLDYLVKKNYIEARKGNPEQEKQDSKRVYYHITKPGFEALQKARKLQKTLWQGIPDFVSDAGKNNEIRSHSAASPTGLWPTILHMNGSRN